MKALVLEAYGRLALRDTEPPPLAEDGVLVRVMACGICGSDVHGMDGSTGRRIPPVVMGHEASGEISAVGPRVTGWSVGDRVTFDSTISCGACWFCQRGQINLCDNRRVLGVSCGEYRQNGAFAGYVAVPARILYRLPDKVRYEQAALTESLSIAVHAVRRSGARAGDASVVVGAGQIGLLVVQVLKLSGASPIVAVDVDADRLALARKLGADYTLQSGPDTARQVQALTEGRGADVALEVVGSTPAIAVALSSLRKGGALTLVGNITPRIELGLQETVTREITVYGSCASCLEYPLCLKLIEHEDVDVGALISAVAPLEEGPSWFQRLYGKEKGLMKVVLTP